MPKEETIELRHVRNVIGEKEDLPSYSPRDSLSAKLKAISLNQTGLPTLSHYYGGYVVNKTLTLTAGRSYPSSSYSDGTHLYLGFKDNPAGVVKINLSTFTEVSYITFAVGESNIQSIVSDGTYLYCLLTTNPAQIIKIYIPNFTRTSTLILTESGNGFSLGIDGTYLYVGLSTDPGEIVRVILSTFTEDSTLTLNAGESNINALTCDAVYLYATTGSDPGYVVRVNRDDFTRKNALSLTDETANNLFYDGLYLYATTQSAPVGMIKRINVDSFTVESSLSFSAGETPYAIFSNGSYIFVGFGTTPGKYAIIDSSTFQLIKTIALAGAGENNIYSLFFDGIYLYLALYLDPGRVVRNYIIPSVPAYEKKINTIDLNIDTINTNVNTLNTNYTTVRAAYLDNLIGVATFGTYTHANNTNEQDVLEFAAAIQQIDIELDIKVLLQTTTVREYVKVDGTNYKQVSSKILPTDFDPLNETVIIQFIQKNSMYKVTLQSSVAEGAEAYIKYEYLTRSLS